MEILFFVWLEGRFYDFIAYLLCFFLSDYRCVYIWFLEGIDFLENSRFCSRTANYSCCLRLFDNV